VTALDLAARIASGAVSAAEALEEAIARAEAANARLNAIVRPLYDEARAEIAAGLPDGPFTGVPLPLKDLSIAYGGVPTTGACRALAPAGREERMAHGDAYALRLVEDGTVVARKDIRTGYHLASVVDDALQGVTLVTRGEDLAFALPIHNRLQRLLGLPRPDYEHHRLLRDANGRRLAKRDRALTLQSLRRDGVTPGEIRARIAQMGGVF